MTDVYVFEGANSYSGKKSFLVKAENENAALGKICKEKSTKPMGEIIGTVDEVFEEKDVIEL